MSATSVSTTAPRLSDVGRWFRRLSVLIAVAAITVGVAALAWPDATVRIIGFLFGVYLVVTGVVRTIWAFAFEELPAVYRVVGVVFGVLTAIVGLICMRNVLGSATLLVLLVAIGWLLDGIVDIALAIGAGGTARGRGLLGGAVSILAAVVLLVWPAVSLATFIALGAIALIVIAAAQLAVTVRVTRAVRTGRGQS